MDAPAESRGRPAQSPLAPRVSVIVMTVNRPERLRQCLASLVAQTVSPNTFEVILVDASGGLAAGAVDEFAARLRLVHLVGPNRGVAANRNTGVRQSQSSTIACLDDDCVAHPQWLEHLTAAVEAHPRCLVGGQVENADPSSACAVAGQVITEAVDAFFNPPGETPRFFPGLSLAMRRSDYLAIGGCDERFGRLAAEDRDLADRWRLAGGVLVRCPDARVIHAHRRKLRGFTRQYVNYGRGAWRYHRLRRQRASGKMRDDLGLHVNMHRHLGPSLRAQAPWMRVKVTLLLAVWQLANLAGFVWQGSLETLTRRPEDRG